MLIKKNLCITVMTITTENYNGKFKTTQQWNVQAHYGNEKLGVDA